MRLKGLIYTKGLSQWAVAQKLGWTESRLSRVVTGRQIPTDEEFTALSRVLGVSETKIRQLIDVNRT